MTTMTSNTKIDITTLSQEEIQEILNTLSIREMLNKYKLTAEFCVRYILSTDDYAADVEDSYYDTEDVLAYQEHLTIEDLQEVYEQLGL
jgi:hypothetical protein